MQNECVNICEKIWHKPQSEVQSIIITSRVNRIHVAKSSDEEIRICWNDTKLRKTEIAYKNGVLEISEQSVVAFYEMFALIELGRQKDIYIHIPDNFEGEVVIHSSHEPIYAENVCLLGYVEIESGTGKIQLSDVSGKRLLLNSKHGGIYARGLAVFEKMQATSVTGSLDFLLKDSAVGYDIQAKTEHGSGCLPSNYKRGTIPVTVLSSTGNINIIIR